MKSTCAFQRSLLLALHAKVRGADVQVDLDCGIQWLCFPSVPSTRFPVVNTKSHSCSASSHCSKSLCIKARLCIVIKVSTCSPPRTRFLVRRALCPNLLASSKRPSPMYITARLFMSVSSSGFDISRWRQLKGVQVHCGTHSSTIRMSDRLRCQIRGICTSPQVQEGAQVQDNCIRGQFPRTSDPVQTIGVQLALQRVV
jgi:hypothetical protein